MPLLVGLEDSAYHILLCHYKPPTTDTKERKDKEKERRNTKIETTEFFSGREGNMTKEQRDLLESITTEKKNPAI